MPKNDPMDYSDAVAGMEEFGVSLVGLLREMLRHNGIVVHTIDHRVKTESSARKKIETAEGAYESYTGLHDLLGLRITCYFSDEVDKVAEVIDREFKVDPGKSVNKGETLGVREFGYKSVHRVARLGKRRVDLAEYRRFNDMQFELQIRTVLQHAWAEIEHDLGYKQETIPEPMRRRFSMLAGVLELVDYEFESIRKQLEGYIAEADVAAKTNTIDMDLDVATLTSLIQHDAKIQEIDAEIARIARRRLSNKGPHPRYMEHSIKRCRDLGIHTIQELRDELGRWHLHLSTFASLWLARRDEMEQETVSPFVKKSEVFPHGVAIFYLWLIIGLEVKPKNLNASADVLESGEAAKIWAQTVKNVGAPPPLPPVAEGEWGWGI